MQTLRFLFILATILFLFAALTLPTVSHSQVQPAVESTLRGDINEDGRVDIFDLLQMLTLLGSGPQSERQRQVANVDKSADGQVNIFDLLAMLTLLSSGQEPEEIFWGPAIAGLNRLSAAVGDTLAVAVINLDISITSDQCKAYVMGLQAEITAFSTDTIRIVIPQGFTGGDLSLIVADDTTNSRYLNLQVRQAVQAAEGGVVLHPQGPGVDIPAGALQADAAVSVELPTAAQLGQMDIPADTGSAIVLFGPAAAGLNKPVTLALPWPAAATEADSLGAQYYDQAAGKWKAAGVSGSDPGRRLVYVQSDRLAAFKAVRTQTVRVRFITSAGWSEFRLAGGGLWKLHHLLAVSGNAAAEVDREGSILLSQPPENSAAGAIAEMEADMSVNAPDMSAKLEFSFARQSDESTWSHVALANYFGDEPNKRENFWIGGVENSKTERIAAADLFSRYPARVPVALDPTTLDKKVLFGYQGWFMCPGEGSSLNQWFHWFRNNTPDAAHLNVDFWPDMSEMSQEERIATDMILPDGSPAEVYSSYNKKTTIRHFKWMEDYDLDGVFLQRHITEIQWSPEWFCFRNKVLQNARAGAEAHGRVFAIEYAGVGGDFTGLKNDWIFLVDVLRVTESPNYLYHKGKPLLGFYGMNWSAADSLTKWLAEEAEPRYQATLFGGIPNYMEDRMWNWNVFDVASPWTVGIYRNACEIEYHKERYLLPDMAQATARGVDYMPVVWPGFSWLNMYHDAPLNYFPRKGGHFYWQQVYNAVSAGAKMIFIAMFDEVDEGTSMFKVVPTSAGIPVGAELVTLDMDGYTLPSDWYLQLARETGRMLRGEIPLSPEMPLHLPPYDPDLDGVVVPDIALVAVPGGTFEMGSANADAGEAPVHTVAVVSFQMSRYEITNAQYAAYLNEVLGKSDEIPWISAFTAGVNGSFCDKTVMFTDFTSSYDPDNRCWISYDETSGFSVAPGKEDLPVVYVTWYGAWAFASRYGFDLPTEAEWEYACRGGAQLEHGTDDGTLSTAKANYGSGLGSPARVGSYPANPFGLYDMSGNVSEWCSDWFGGYGSASQSDPAGPEIGTGRVRRGGNWLDEAGQCRSASRSSGDPETTAYGCNTGFRVVRRP